MFGPDDPQIAFGTVGTFFSGFQLSWMTNNAKIYKNFLNM